MKKAHKITRATAKNRANYSELLANISTAYANKRDKNDPVFVDALQELSQAVAFSVINKVIDPTAVNDVTTPREKVADGGHNPALLALRRDLGKAINDLQALANAAKVDYVISKHHTHKNGDEYIEYIKSIPDVADRVTAIARDTLGDGIDLMQEASLAILSEIEKQTKRDPEKPVDLERAYTARQPKKRVVRGYAKNDAPTLWHDVETTPIQQIYKAVRNKVNGNKAVESNSKFVYLEDYTTDPENPDIGTTIYRNFGRYTDIGGIEHQVDKNGNGLVYTVDRESADRYYSRIQELKLTAREMRVVLYRMQGLGYKSIAASMGISIDNCKRCARRIREKAEKIGFVPSEKERKKYAVENLLGAIFDY